MSKLFNTETIHVEISSKCTLKCPRCPRTELKPNQLNREITLAQFKTAFNNETLANVRKIIFCGDVGDPIYATELIPIVRYLKENSVNVVIVTNGSYKSTEWWQELGSVLTVDDRVTFSIDGWDQVSNNQYRVNSNFDSIFNGITTLRLSSLCKIHWSCIYFSFNVNHVDKIKEVARIIGCDELTFVASSKFDGNYAVNGVDPLKPHEYYVTPPGSSYKKTSILLNSPKKLELQLHRGCHSWAKCLNWKKELFVNVDGLVFPCPWFNSGYQENDFVTKYADRLNIKTRSLEEVLNDPLWNEFLVRLETFPLDVCRIKCQNDI